MDDGVVLEPMVGNRVHHSLQCLGETMQLVNFDTLEVTLPDLIRSA